LLIFQAELLLINKTPIVLIGGGGHCRSCIDVIESTNKYIIEGIIDLKENIGKKILGYSVIGDDKDIEKLTKDGFCFHIAIGQIKTADKRIQINNILKQLNADQPTIISPLAYLSPHSRTGSGTIVMHHAFINANVLIGENCIINTKALIEHDSRIDNFCHISTSAVLNGNVIIKENVFIGSNATIFPNTTVNSGSIIGAGKTIQKDVMSGEVIR